MLIALALATGILAVAVAAIGAYSQATDAANRDLQLDLRMARTDIATLRAQLQAAERQIQIARLDLRNARQGAAADYAALRMRER